MLRKKYKIVKDKYSYNYLLIDKKGYVRWYGTKKNVKKN